MAVVSNAELAELENHLPDIVKAMRAVEAVLSARAAGAADLRADGGARVGGAGSAVPDRIRGCSSEEVKNFPCKIVAYKLRLKGGV